MISLIELAKAGTIEKTGAKPKLPIRIDGVSSATLDVYKIPLEYLYYNDRNGRIATGISQYNEELRPANDREDPAYNDFVASLLKKDNAPALKRTKKSIATTGQQVYGYVLDDGRIVDGNRRYTALRELCQETGQTTYFEAVVLPFSYNNSAERAKIKKLELAIQMGIEERQDYDPVDLAVDIYQTTSGSDPIMTLADYAAGANMKLKKATEYYHGAFYMREFLKFIGTTPQNFQLIKENKIWALFLELSKSLAKNFADDAESQVRKNQTMESYFGFILHQIHVGVTGNTARNHARDFMRCIVATENNEKFNDAVFDVVEDLADSLQESSIDTTADLMKGLTEENDLITEFGDVYDTYLRDAKNGESVEKFINSVKKSVQEFQRIKNDGGLAGKLRFTDLSNAQLQELQTYMRDLNQVSKELFKQYGNEVH